MPSSVPKRGKDIETMVWGKKHSSIATAWMFCGLLVFTHAAQAANTPAEQAGEMLARAQALNQKCNYLNAADKAHLLRLVQKAEHALTMRANADIAGAAMRHGREAGADSDCSCLKRKISKRFSVQPRLRPIRLALRFWLQSQSRLWPRSLHLGPALSQS